MQRELTCKIDPCSKEWQAERGDSNDNERMEIDDEEETTRRLERSRGRLILEPPVPLRLVIEQTHLTIYPLKPPGVRSSPGAAAGAACQVAHVNAWRNAATVASPRPALCNNSGSEA
ncbi:hypothetical protein CCHR01_16967 [Colletotrichum chrysophilum]|uniref:Uncharacterized protein n=1 Tax=Colletotrichum chrysophilum TaxID=1836956 RepID=A0AAD9A4M8_9PEZI|nr:hypothetical protein CCHR01_16967 [Colletotrichum chrysophilum]